MTFHASRLSAKRARGSAPGDCVSPRIAVSLPEADMACLCWWAAKKGVPVATVMRNAVWAYLQCVRADFEREK